MGAHPRRATRIDPDWFAEHDIHIHVPAGAVPKDGPSAGVTMATAIVSLVSGRAVSEEVGMTGEITLTGQVLQIGGLREKVLAAQRAGLKKVILPRENEADLERVARRRRARRSRSCSPRRSRRCSRQHSGTARLPGRTRQRSDRRHLVRNAAGARPGRVQGRLG